MKQIKLVTEESYLQQLIDDKELFLDGVSFEDYINMEIGILYDEKHVVENISHSDDMKRFVIVYRFTLR